MLARVPANLTLENLELASASAQPNGFELRGIPPDLP